MSLKEMKEFMRKLGFNFSDKHNSFYNANLGICFNVKYLNELNKKDIYCEINKMVEERLEMRQSNKRDIE